MASSPRSARSARTSVPSSIPDDVIRAMWTWSSSKNSRACATVEVGVIVFGAVTITSSTVRPVSGGMAAGTSWMIVTYPSAAWQA